MTIKLGNTEINAVSVIEPYGDDLTVVADEPLEPWVRPSHWLDMPVINSGDQKCAFLFAVSSGYSMNNYVSIYARGNIAGNIHSDFTIDWGDGTSHICNEYHSQFVQPDALTATHEFNFEDLSQSTEFEDNGTKYRQALIVFDSPSSGIDSFGFWNNKNYPGGYRLPNFNFLEININLPSGIGIGGNQYGSGRRRPLLEKARIYSPKTTDLQWMLADSPRLRSVEFGPFENLTRTAGLFTSCTSLDNLPQLDTSNVLDMNSMLSNCGIKHYNNQYDLSSCTGVVSMFNGCRNLKTVHIDMPPNINRADSMFRYCRSLIAVSGNWGQCAVSNFSESFAYNYSLVSIPDMNLSSTNNIRMMFYSCYKLRKTPRLNLPNCIYAESAFNTCTSLKTVTLEDLSNPNLNSANGMFSSCVDLRVFKIINPKLAPTGNYGLSSAFYNCYELQKVEGVIDTSGCRRMDSMFNRCFELKKIEKIKTPTINNFDSTFSSCHKLTKSPITDVSCEGTGNVSMYQTFLSCTELQEVPNLDYSRCWRMRDTFNSCSSVSGGLDIWDTSLNNRSINTDSNNFRDTFSYCGIEYINHMIIPESAVFVFPFNNSKIKRIPYVSASGAYSIDSMFHYTYRINQAALSGVDNNIGYYRSSIPSGEIYKLFDGLASGVTSKTVDLRDVAEAYILHPDTISIATSKGWTVTT